jgi:hypothetical protein
VQVVQGVEVLAVVVAVTVLLAEAEEMLMAEQPMERQLELISQWVLVAEIQIVTAHQVVGQLA